MARRDHRWRARRTDARESRPARIGVLELVDQDVADRCAERRAHVRAARQQLARVMEQVVEVEQRGRALGPLKRRDHLADLVPL